MLIEVFNRHLFTFSASFPCCCVFATRIRSANWQQSDAVPGTDVVLRCEWHIYGWTINVSSSLSLSLWWTNYVMVLLNESNVSNFLWVNSWNIQIHTSVLSSDCLILSLSQCYGFTLTLSSSLVCFAGVGTRNYYRKMGYELEGPYMVKDLYGPGMDWTWTVFIWTVFFFFIIYQGHILWSQFLK